MERCDLSKCEPLNKNTRQQCEPLCAGDVTKYWSFVRTCGDPRRNCAAKVLEGSLHGRQLLDLINMECLGNEIQIKRVFIVSENETLDVTYQSFEGSYCQVEEFDLVEGCIKLEDLPIEHPGTMGL